jgi:hypothetical protein
MALQRLRDTVVTPYEDGRLFGTAGPYEWVNAIAEFTVDPASEPNGGITDLELAPRDPDGLVGFEADLRILRPVGPGNGRLLFVVANRGMLGGVPFSGAAAFDFPATERLSPGDGFLLERGWTIVWCGWQWDVLRAPGVIGLAAPIAEVEPGWMRVEFRPDAAQADHPLSDSSVLFTFADYPTAALDDPEAVLYERLAPGADPVPVERSRWHFADESTVTLDGGFQPFRWYTLVYRTNLCPVTGVGMLAVRDAVSYLRREGGYDRALAYGVSQSGRLLRQFLYEGRNLDEDGNLVFDGVFAHIAGGRRGEFNHRYAQPSLTHVIGFSNLPPYDSAGLLATQRAAGGVPKLILTNSSWEYWRGDGALVHQDSMTGADLPPDPDTRAYLFSGTDHLGGFAIKGMMPAANPVHTHDVSPLLRALFVVLDEWACEAIAPPPSEVPRWADGTAAQRTDVLAQFAALSGIDLPDPDVLNVTREVDLGDRAEAGIGRWPLVLGAAKPAIVSAVDSSGNERAGIALPIVAVPAAAYTGWNPRRPVPGLPDVLYEFVGSKLPLPPGSPQLSARDYELAVRAAARELVSRRLLLEVDVETTVREALEAAL